MPGTVQVIRLPDADTLAQRAADALLHRLIVLQEDGRVAQLGLTGGRIANVMYELLSKMVVGSNLDPARLSLWWGDDRFLPTDDPDRNSLQALTRLAGGFPLTPAHTHPMPSSDQAADPSEAAVAYADEFGATVLDICLLGIGEDGHVASIFPDHPSSEATSAVAIGVSGAAKPPSERVSLSLGAINRSAEVWLLASGDEKQDAVARALQGEASVPAAHVAGTERTLWFVDYAAARSLPYHECHL